MFRSPSAGSLPHSSASQTRFVQDRIQSIEKHFGDICSALAIYTKKIAGQRDKGDVLAQTLNDYASAEIVNKQCSQGIKEFADSLIFLSDYRDICVHRLEETVIQGISEYGSVVKSAMEDVRSCSSAYDKEIAHLKQLHKLRQQSPLSRMQISKAESDLAQATNQSIRLGRTMQDRLDRMEKKKLQDLIGWMKTMTLIEMSLHSSSLAVLTRAYRQLNNIDVDSDLEEFRNTLRQHLPTLAGDHSSPVMRSGSVPSIALPKTPTPSSGSGTAKIKRSKSMTTADYRHRAESPDSLKVEEYEELKHDESESEEDEENEEDEELNHPRTQSRSLTRNRSRKSVQK